MTAWPPVSSEEVRELREAESARARDELHVADPVGHRCEGGWVGETGDGLLPIACGVCRPHVRDRQCTTCGTRRSRCREQQLQLNGRCCVDCQHEPRRVR